MVETVNMCEVTDQLRVMLGQETRYVRDDYIGCFSSCNADKQDTVSIIPQDNSSSQPLDDTLFQARRSKQCKLFKNTSVNTQTTTQTKAQQQTLQRKKPLFSEYHRTRLCEWAIEVINYYSFPLKAVELTMNILDRYLAQNVPPEERNMDTLHLLTLTSLYLALKLTTVQRPAPQVFCRLARSKFTTQQVEETELCILQGLGWYVHPPTAEEFCQYYVLALQDAYPPGLLRKMEACAMASIRTTLMDYVWVRFLPSTVAMGALSWGLHQLGMLDRYPSPLAELHKRNVLVHQVDSASCLEYFYLRAVYSEEEGAQQALPKMLRKRPMECSNSDTKGPRNSSSPVSILKDNPAVIQDDEEEN